MKGWSYEIGQDSMAREDVPNRGMILSLTIYSHSLDILKWKTWEKVPFYKTTGKSSISDLWWMSEY